MKKFTIIDFLVVAGVIAFITGAAINNSGLFVAGFYVGLAGLVGVFFRAASEEDRRNSTAKDTDEG